MEYKNWMNYIQNANKSSIIAEKIRKVYYKFNDGKEMCEEYSMETGILLRRAWKKKPNILGDSDWDVELGETMPNRHDDIDNIIKETNTEVLNTYDHFYYYYNQYYFYIFNSQY